MNSRVVVRVVLVLLAVLGVVVVSDAQAQQYEVFAVRYGVLPGFQTSDLIAGAPRGEKIDIPVMFWVVRGNGRTILVDCGFHRDRLVQRWKVRSFVKPSDAIAPLGLKPEDVTDIVLTHMHWDHAGSLDLFPKATVWLQKAEYAYYTGDAWQPKGNHGGIEPDNAALVARLNTEGRVRFIDGTDQSPIPGIRCYTGGRHTEASQFLTVSTAAGTVVLASDNVYLYQNFEKHAPIAQTLDAASNLKTQELIVKLATNPRLIVPGHDPAVFTRYKEVGPGIVKIE